MRVLVVDDDDATRELLSAALEQRGWEVVLASDGVEGLERARQNEIDVCISDILMPLMDGYMLCREWRADPALRETPFVFYTATYTSDEDQEFALSLGADGFLTKPSDPEHLVALVEPLLRVQAGVRRSVGTVRESVAGAEQVLKGYSERLVRKLEDKVLELEEANRRLSATLDALGDEVGVKGELIQRLNDEMTEDGSLSVAVHADAPEAELKVLVEQRTSELLAANARLEEAARAKSAFLAGMGHEMRNKLNSVIGFSGILLQGLGGELDPEQRKHVEMVYEAGQTLLALVNDVVDLSKIEAGQLQTRIEPFELLGFLDGLVETFQGGARDKGIRVELVAPAGVIPMHSDRAKLEQIVRNLVSNGLKFTSQGAVTVEAERADDGNSVVIRVRDTGEGIAPDVMDRIFDEFVKYDRRDRAGTSGTGLGLALTRKLGEMLGGSVSARSNPGEGSVFTLVIPVDISVGSAHDVSSVQEGGAT